MQLDPTHEHPHYRQQYHLHRRLESEQHDRRVNPVQCRFRDQSNGDGACRVKEDGSEHFDSGTGIESVHRVTGNPTIRSNTDAGPASKR